MSRGIAKTYYVVLLLATILGSTIALLPAPTFASSLTCGDTITVSTTLRADIGPCPGNGITIGANNIVLDCAGHTLTGIGTEAGLYAAVLVSGVNGVTVVNCKASDFFWGFRVFSSTHIILLNDKAISDLAGFSLVGSSYNIIANSMAVNNVESQGIGVLFNSNYNIVVDNIATNDYYGFAIFGNSNLVSNNVANGNLEYGYLDVSTGSGTAGTANVYLFDHCGGNLFGGSNPTGLCMPQP
jgi:parallel beta-helix repeat protein